MKLSIDSKMLVAALLVAGCGAATQNPDPPGAASATPADPPAAETAAPDTGAPPADTAAATTEPAAPTKADIKSERKDGGEGSARQQLMKAHFNQTATIREALISGKIHKAVRPAAALTRIQVKELPKLWQRSVQQLQVASKRIREGSDLQEIAAATADIGRACATCHAAGGGPKIKVGVAPSDGGTMAERMKRHMWATERLWEGIYGPSDAAWKAGVAALEVNPFPNEALNKGGVHARSSAARFSKHAKGAGGQKTADQRTRLYSKLLATCAPCHEAMGVVK
jgi:hypothetical protein